MPGLRICGIVPIYVHPDWRGGGLSRTATDLLMVQAKRGNQVTVISPLFDGDHVFEMPDRRSFYDGRLELVYSTRARSSKLRFGTTADGLAEHMAPVLRSVDVVYIHSFMSHWTDRAAKLAKQADVPYVIQDHGKLTSTVLKNRSVAKKLYLMLGGWQVLRDAACVVPSSEVVASEIRSWDASIACETCTNGLDEADFAGELPARPLNEPYVLFLGWLDPRKRPDLLVRAFGKIAERVKPWKLALVGPDSYGMLESLTQLIEKEQLQDRVALPGMVRGRERLAWLRNAGIFVLPSEGEGLSLSMLEAAASGVPMLLSQGCNYPEAEECGAGRILELRDDVWAEAMREMIEDSKERESVGAHALQLFRRNHTLDAVGEHLEGLLRRAIARRSGSLK